MERSSITNYPQQNRHIKKKQNKKQSALHHAALVITFLGGVWTVIKRFPALELGNGTKNLIGLSEVHNSDRKSQTTQLSVARLRITQHTLQTGDLYSNWAWLPKRYKPQRAREIATQIRFFCDKKPISFSLLLRTRETRMMSFSCPCRRKWLGMMRASFSNVVDSSFLKFSVPFTSKHRIWYRISPGSRGWRIRITLYPLIVCRIAYTS